MRILIADDDEAILSSFTRCIQRFRPDDEIVGVVNGEAALAHLEQQSFDLLLTDYQMPGLDGLELVRRVRARWPNLPVVMISGQCTPELRQQAVSAGVSEILAKPVTPLHFPGIFRRVTRGASGLTII